MKISIAPMFVSLALCGAAALTAGAATAQPARTPSDANRLRTARLPTAADLAARHKQFCQDAYAHQAGDLAYLEARLSLTPAQQPLFERWETVEIGIAKRGAADCATRELPTRNQAKQTPMDAMAHEEEILKRRVAELDAERPALSAFYNMLTDGQKMAFMHPEPEPMVSRHRMFSQALTPDMEQRSNNSARPDRAPAGGTPPQ